MNTSKEALVKNKKANLFLINALRHKEITGKFPIGQSIALWHLLPKKELFDKLLNCNSEKLVIFLKTPILYEKFTCSERLQILCRYEPFVTAIYNKPELVNNLGGTQLALLGQNNHNFAKEILKNKIFRNKMTAKDLAILGQKDFNTARFILEEPLLLRKIFNTTANYLGTLGCCDIQTSNHIFKKYQLDVYNLSQITDNLKYDNIIDEFKKFYNESLLLDNFVQFGKNNLIIANYLIQEYLDYLISKNEGHHFAEFGENLLEIANFVLHYPGIQEKLNGNHLARLGQNNFDNALYILNTPDLSNRLDGADLAKLGQNNFEIAYLIFNNSKLIEKLNNYDLAELGKNIYKISEYILEHSDLCNKLNGYNLALLGSVNSDSARLILNRADLLIKLNSKNLLRMGHENPEIAQFILKNQEFCVELEDILSLVFRFCDDYPEISQLILKRSENAKDFEGFSLIKRNFSETLENRIKLWQLIHQTCLDAVEQDLKSENKKNCSPKIL